MMEVSMVKRHGLRDDQFARIENLLPGRPGHVGRNSEGGNRLFVEADKIPLIESQERIRIDIFMRDNLP